MNLLYLLLPATVILTWTLGAQLAIWWPYTVTAGSSRARALHAARYAAVGIALGVVLLALIILALQNDQLLPFALGALAIIAFLQTPLALTAVAVARGERTLAIACTPLIVVFASVLLWDSFWLALALLLNGVALLSAVAWLTVLLEGVALAGVLEMYVAIRQPRARWDERHDDLL
jgi:hypothetical protein